MGLQRAESGGQPHKLVDVKRLVAEQDRRFQLETNIATNDSFCAADLMISDWSGAALEFAFATERPGLFVDVPRKVNNPDY